MSAVYFPVTTFSYLNGLSVYFLIAISF